MKKTGWFILFCALFLTVNLWILSKGDMGLVRQYPFKSLGQITALLGTVLISFEFFLAARLKFMENWFGGLDKVYHAHRLIGGSGFALIIYHPLFLIVNALPNIKAAMNFVLPSSILSYDYGLLAFYAMFVLIFLTFYVKLPYRIWKISHIFMGVPLVFMLMHMLFISSDISNYMPLRYWILGISFLSLAAYIYKRFLYTRFGPRHEYIITQVRQVESVTEIVMKPVWKKLEYQAGQFAFISFENKWLSREKHPFTIASSPDDETLRFAIKSLGDYTNKLEVVRAGDRVAVFGPYGQFGEKANTSLKDQVWIAGGIGVTPFLSLAKYLSVRGNTGNITVYYCIKNMNEAMYAEELSRATANPKFKILNFCSDVDGRINTETIVKQSGDPKDKLILLCGPGGMTSALSQDFENRYHVPRRNIIFEEFSFLGT